MVKILFFEKNSNLKVFLGVSLLSYGSYPVTKGGLLAHELAHTLGVIHPNQLSYLCNYYPTLSFCQNSALLTQCQCLTTPEQCLMTNQFGLAKTNAAKYTACDIEMMNYFSSDIPCLIKVKILSEKNKYSMKILFFFSKENQFIIHEFQIWL